MTLSFTLTPVTNSEKEGGGTKQVISDNRNVVSVMKKLDASHIEETQ